MRKETEELQMLAVKFYKDMHSCKKVGKRLGLGATTVYRLLKNAGVVLPTRHSSEVNNQKKKLSGDKLKGVIAAYLGGESMRSIQSRFSCGQSSIYTALKDFGIERRPRGGQPREISLHEKQEMVRLYTQERWAQETIASKFLCHQSTISSVLRQMGVETRHKNAKGERHGSWKGGKIINSDGYVFIKIPSGHFLSSMNNSSGYVSEHRLVMAESLGRPLNRNETVHHINGDRKDNRIENLQLRQGKHGKGVVMCCASCGSTNIISNGIA